MSAAIREALEPFARNPMASASDIPDETPVRLGGTDGFAETIITVGDLRRARTALEAIPSEGTVKAQDELGTAAEWKAKREELQGWTGSAWLAGETDEDFRPELYGFLCGLIGWMHAGENAAACLTPTLSGEAVPVGEAVAWRFRFKLGDGLSAWEVTLDESYARSMAVNGGEVEPLGPITARPAEEPGEVERLTRERDALAEALEQINSTSLSEVFDGRIGEIVSAAREVLAGRFDFNAHSLKVNLARETARADAAEAALAETREALRDLLTKPTDPASFQRARAALTGDAQEAGR